MKIGFFIAHPSQYYIFKVLSMKLSSSHEIFSFYVPKDILSELMDKDCFDTYPIRIDLPEKKNFNYLSHIYSLFYKEKQLISSVKKIKPDLLVGTSIAIAHVGCLLRIPSIILTEDDLSVISKSAYMGYPMCTKIISPKVCNLGRFNRKKIGYDGYQKLVYLHPSNFEFKPDVLKKHHLDKKDYIILRFSALQAHHDIGIKGISSSIVKDLVDFLNPHYHLLISSEKKLDSELEAFRYNVNVSEIHHILARAKLFISDSQSMSVEASLLGTPSIRISDLVNKISVLNELEHKYGMTYGLIPNKIEENKDVLIEKINKLLRQKDFGYKADRIIKEKINVANFFCWLLDGFPESIHICEKNPNYQEKFMFKNCYTNGAN